MVVPPDIERLMIERLAEIHAAQKSFDSAPEWREVTDRSGTRLVCHEALRLDGKLGGGVFVRIHTPRTNWESDVYGQIEALKRQGAGRLRLDAVEWEPLKPHTNRRDAPSEHRLVTLTNRIHPFAVNRRYGLSVFEQSDKGVAVDFPRQIKRFEEYLALCAETWNFPDLRDLQPPKWSKQLV